MTATGAARAAGYKDDGGDLIRQTGYRCVRSTAVVNMLAMAQAETGQGDEGVVKSGEAKRILSRLARGSDPAVRIRAIEALAKQEAVEREVAADRARNPDTPESLLKDLASVSPELAAVFAKSNGLDWPWPREAK
jgi:hypothetical protein